MTEKTMKTAVEGLVAPLGESAIISDGAQDWFPEALLEALASDDEIQDLAVVEGEEIRRLDGQGLLVSGEPVYRIRAPSSVSISEVEGWVAEHAPEAIKGLAAVVASPEVSQERAEGGEYMIWTDGEIPESVEQALRSVAVVLDVWLHEEPAEARPEDVESFEVAIQAVEQALPLGKFRREIGTYTLTQDDEGLPGWDLDSLCDALSSALELAGIKVQVEAQQVGGGGLSAEDDERITPLVDRLVSEVTTDPQSSEIPVMIRDLQDAVLSE